MKIFHLFYLMMTILIKVKPCNIECTCTYAAIMSMYMYNAVACMYVHFPSLSLLLNIHTIYTVMYMYSIMYMYMYMLHTVFMYM